MDENEQEITFRECNQLEIQKGGWHVMIIKKNENLHCYLEMGLYKNMVEYRQYTMHLCDFMGPKYSLEHMCHMFARKLHYTSNLIP